MYVRADTVPQGLCSAQNCRKPNPNGPWWPPEPELEPVLSGEWRPRTQILLGLVGSVFRGFCNHQQLVRLLLLLLLLPANHDRDLPEARLSVRARWLNILATRTVFHSVDGFYFKGSSLLMSPRVRCYKGRPELIKLSTSRK
jgi:hypothetical protein